MARTRTHQVPAALSTGELTIEITPDSYVFWRGTAAQLMDELLIPFGLEWPVGTDEVTWDDNFGIHYTLKRCRPEGMKGPMKAWTSGDWWWCCAKPIDFERRQARKVERMREELAAEIRRQRTFDEDLERAVRIKADPAFKAFKQRLGMLP